MSSSSPLQAWTDALDLRIVFLTERDTMLAFTQLPHRLLPVFIVPLVILSHLLVFVRLRRGAPSAAAPRA